MFVVKLEEGEINLCEEKSSSALIEPIPSFFPIVEPVGQGHGSPVSPLGTKLKLREGTIWWCGAWLARGHPGHPPMPSFCPRARPIMTRRVT